MFSNLLTIDTDVIIAMAFSIAIVVITSRQAFQKQLSAVIFTSHRNIEISEINVMIESIVVGESLSFLLLLRLFSLKILSYCS